MPDPGNYQSLGWLIVGLAGLLTLAGGLIFGIRKITGVDALAEKIDHLVNVVAEQAKQIAILSIEQKNHAAQVAHWIEQFEKLRSATSEVQGHLKK